jgi:hypothetical protein
VILLATSLGVFVGGRGPAPKPAHLRQRTNKKAGATVLEARVNAKAPKLEHPRGEIWHPRTLVAWRKFFESPMASEWLPTDIDGLEMLADCYDKFYKTGDLEALKEIRLQRPNFGLTPLDRTRLHWEVAKTSEAEQKAARRAPAPMRRTGTDDPRSVLMAVK